MSLSNWTLAVAQGTLGSSGAECFAKPFRQGNRAAAVEIHSNVNLSGLSAELAIADACYAVLEYRRGSARTRDKNFDIDLVAVKDWGSKLSLNINSGKADTFGRE